MKVVLLQDVKGVGRRMEIKDVSDGYARNFLLPKKLAKAADESGLKIKSEFDAKEQKLIAELKIQAERLSAEPLVFKVKIGDKGEVFSGINKDQIKKALDDRGIRNAKINLAKPLKVLGKHQVEITFPRGIKAIAVISLEPER